VGPFLALPPLLFDAGSVLFGHFASVRRRHRPDGSPDRLLFTLAALLTVVLVATPFGRTPWESVVFAGIGMAGGGGAFTMISVDYLARVHPSLVSTASGMAAAAQSMTYIVFAPLLGKLIETSGGYVTPYLALGVWMIPGCAAWLLWKPPPPYREDVPATATT
jgi:MFS family permease